MEELNDKIEEYNRKALETVTTVQDLILEAIKDRMDLEERMLEGRIDMEEEIMDILTERYEKERDQTIELAELKKETLEDEIDLVDELLEQRRKAAEEEDRAAKIEELEAQLARISADPTRKKEELELREEINDLREEMAWDMAEEEAEAQKESLEEQIDSIDDFIEYVEDYYEELFANPVKLIDETTELLKKTDDEILAWLQENSEEFKAASESRQEQMIDEWQGTLNDMRGVTETYWDEVAEVMQGTDEEILDFLKKYSQDFQEASAEQAELYVKEWTDALEEWRKAYKQVADEIKSYDYTPTYSSGSGGGGGGGGGSGGGGGGGSYGGGGGTTQKKTYTARADVKYKNRDGSWSKVTAQRSSTVSLGAAKEAAKEAAFTAAQSACRASYANGTYSQSSLNSIYRAINSRSSRYVQFVKYYKEGGIADFTGPAWLDGTKTKPERVLSAKQTALFEGMVKSLEAMSTIRVPWFGGFRPDIADSGNRYTIENITISVDKLDDDADYEEIARKVGEAMMKGFSKTNAVGGIRKSW